MNTKPQLSVTLSPEQVRERLKTLAERTFKSAVNNAELQLLVRATVGDTSTTFLMEDVWQAILNHHYYGSDLTFDEIMDNGEIADVYLQYADEARSVFGNLVALSISETIDDSIDPYPSDEDSDGPVIAVLQQAGEQVNYVCNMAGYGISDETVAKALGEDGYTAIANHFARQWLCNPADLGVSLVEFGFGRDLSTLRSLSSALLTATERYGEAKRSYDKSDQLGVIGLLLPLLKGLVYATIKVPNSAAIAIKAGEGDVELIEKALRDGLAIAQQNSEELPMFRAPRDEDAIATLSTPTERILEMLRSRVDNEQRMRRSVLVD